MRVLPRFMLIPNRLLREDLLEFRDSLETLLSRSNKKGPKRILYITLPQATLKQIYVLMLKAKT